MFSIPRHTAEQRVSIVENIETRHLIVALVEHQEDCVEQVDELAHEVVPAKCSQWHGEVHAVRFVITKDSRVDQREEHHRVNRHLQEVVEDENHFEIANSLFVHESLSENLVKYSLKWIP